MASRPEAPSHTTPPKDGVPVALYDGHCDFCIAQANKLARYARGRITLRSFQGEGVLDDYPGLTHAACMEELKLVGPDGRIYGGAEAIVRVIDRGHPVLGKVLFGYYVPGVRWISDRAYAWVARRRYRLLVPDPSA